MEQPSTQNLAAMPDRDDLIRITKSIAMLDTIICPDWEDRYYSFDSWWGDSEQMASMRNGCGDDWKAHITDDGIIIFGLAHESATCRPDDPWPGLLDDVPPEFASSVAEPAFGTSYLSYCVWLLAGTDSWAVGDIDFPDFPDPDGSIEFLAILDGNPTTYKEWAESYYEQPVDSASVDAIYAGAPLSDALVRSLNSEISLQQLRQDVESIGFA